MYREIFWLRPYTMWFDYVLHTSVTSRSNERSTCLQIQPGQQFDKYRSSSVESGFGRAALVDGRNSNSSNQLLSGNSQVNYFQSSGQATDKTNILQFKMPKEIILSQLDFCLLPVWKSTFISLKRSLWICNCYCRCSNSGTSSLVRNSTRIAGLACVAWIWWVMATSGTCQWNLFEFWVWHLCLSKTFYSAEVERRGTSTDGNV